MHIATVTITKQMTANIASSFPTHLSHVPYCTWATAKPPIIAPQVGVNRFTKPFAELKIMTMVSTEKPRFAAKGPMMGMDTVAMPELDGIKNESTT